MEGPNGGLEGAWFESVGVTIALDGALIRVGTDVIFTFDQHGGVHEKLGDVGESLAEAFGEKNLEKLVLECRVGLFVHGLGLLAVEPQTKGLERTLQATCEGAAPSESPIPLRSVGLSLGESLWASVPHFYRQNFTLPNIRPQGCIIAINVN